MSEQVELWPKPVMYGTGFKITHPTNQYPAWQLLIDKFVMQLMPIVYEVKK